MTTEHDLAHGRGVPRSPSTADDDLMPGRGSRSSQLAAPSHPIAGGLLLRKARDANGVAEDAEHAVAAAASSSGHALPGAVQRKFESSLGADLSSVRVHTGAESHVAAESVGARAYAIGQDIHFAEGQYDPSSAAGQHLLAHEVAHTVQQVGSAPRRQNKLEASTPADTAELEADRAANAMVSDQPAAIAGAMVLARKIQRQELPAKPSTSATDQAIEREFLAELRRLAGNAMLAAFTNYSMAADEVKAEMKDKEARPTLLDTLIDLAVGALVPGAANLVINRVRGSLKLIATTAIGKYVKDADTAASAYQKADDLLEKLKLDDGKAQAGYKLLMGAMKPTSVPGPNGPPAPTSGPPPTGGALPVGGTGTVKVGGLIDAFQQNFAVYRQSLDAKLSGLDENALVGVYAAFDANVVTKSLYAQQIRDLVKMHEEINKAAADEGPIDRERIIMLSAWGITQPAIISYDAGVLLMRKDHWRFVKWVEEPMIPTAIAAGQSQEGGLKTVAAGQAYGGSGLPILGHIDKPKVEGRKVVQVDMWGKERLCWVKLAGDSTAEFVGWVAPDEESFARVKGAQLGGIRSFGQSLKFTNSVPHPRP
jgi:hypothetical protein